MYVNTWENNLNNLYNNEQRFALDTFPAKCAGEALYHVVYLAARL